MSYESLRDNTYILYISGDVDSYNIAIEYANEYEIDISDRLIGADIDPSQLTEILDDEASFDDLLLSPILSYIDNIHCLILSYKVPIGYYGLNGEVISSVSRIMRYSVNMSDLSDISDSEQIKYYRKNKFYNNKTITGYLPEVHHDYGIICSSLHSTSFEDSKKIIENSHKNRRFSIVSGRIYFKDSEQYPFEDEYIDDYINDFVYLENVLLPSLDLDFKSIINSNKKISYLTDDSLYWGLEYGGINKYFFQNTFQPRILFFNVDDGGLSTVENVSEYNWYKYAVDAGYSSICGFADLESADEFPLFSSFIRNISSGNTIGESVFFSLPVFINSFMFFGDPLLSVSFPQPLVRIPSVEYLWDTAAINIAKALAYLYRQGDLVEELIKNTIDTNDLTYMLGALNLEAPLYRSIDYNNPVRTLLRSARNLVGLPIWSYDHRDIINPVSSIQEYLLFYNKRISSLIPNAIDEQFDSRTLLDAGWWRFSFDLFDDSQSYTNYHFKIEVYENKIGEDYYDRVFLIDSSDLAVGWEYEKYDGTYDFIPAAGVSSSNIGRTVRYTSNQNEYLTQCKVYYFRYCQYREVSEGIEEFPWRRREDIIY